MKVNKQKEEHTCEGTNVELALNNLTITPSSSTTSSATTTPSAQESSIRDLQVPNNFFVVGIMTNAYYNNLKNTS